MGHPVSQMIKARAEVQAVGLFESSFYRVSRVKEGRMNHECGLFLHKTENRTHPSVDLVGTGSMTGNNDRTGECRTRKHIYTRLMRD